MPTWLTALLGLLATALFKGFFESARSTEQDQTSKDLGASEAGNATLNTIGKIAAERADLPTAPADDIALARRLRERAERGRRAERGDLDTKGSDPAAS